MFRINSEGDVARLLGNAVRQPDSSFLRTWEVAGASHGDWKLITDYGPLRKRDIGTYPGGYPGEPQTCALPPLSRVPQHMVQNALYDHTVNWVAYGISPPTAPLITTTSTTPPVVARDSLGLALGGIRLAQHEVPLRINTGVNTGPGFCFLDGSSVPLTDAQLAALYPTVRSYVDEVVEGDPRQRRAGYIPRSFTRDPAWYSDIRELIDAVPRDGRIEDRIAAKLLDRLDARRTARRRGRRVRRDRQPQAARRLGVPGHQARHRRARRRASPDAGAHRPALGGEGHGAPRRRPSLKPRASGTAAGAPSGPRRGARPSLSGRAPVRRRGVRRPP